MTDSGRTVYGGGGITPDEKYDAAKLQQVPDRSAPQVRASSTSRRSTSARTPDAKLPKGWEPDDSVVNDFHEYLLKQRLRVHRSRFHRRTTTGSSSS